MKTTILSIILIFSVFCMYAVPEDRNTSNYVETEEGVTYLQQLNYGVDYFLEGKTIKGETVYYNKEEIKKFQLEGKLFVKKRMIKDGKECDQCTFMEKLYTRANYSLFKMIDKVKGKLIPDFYIYYGNKYELKVNKENYKVVLSFFYPTLNELYSS